MSEDMRQPIAVKGVVFEPVQGLPREWAFGEVALVRAEERRTPLWEAQIRAHSTGAPRAWGRNPADALENLRRACLRAIRDHMDIHDRAEGLLVNSSPTGDYFTCPYTLAKRVMSDAYNAVEACVRYLTLLPSPLEKTHE